MSSPSLPDVQAVHEAFIRTAVARLRQQESRIHDCIQLLSEDQVWSRGNENSNSVANLVLHLIGNLGQWVVAGVGGQPDHRDRDAEFQTLSGITREELSARLKARMDQVVDVIENVPAHRLLEIVTPQGQSLPVMEVITHITEHFYHHGGQIMLLTKLFLNVDLGYFKHLASKKR
ncbi:MAG: DUF1572 family protein [Acidobacteria bacterium]|nr:DUF1572 family protein [Acidobacteriota bacterium]